MKSERLKKLEAELKDLKKWLELGLVPKKDIEKHKQEIHNIEAKIDEERQRLIFLKENGDMEEYVLPKRSGQKQVYEHQSMSEVGGNEPASSDQDASDRVDSEMETSIEPDHTTLFDIEEKGEDHVTQEYNSDDDPYSEKNRWKRSSEIQDPEADDW